MYYPHFNLTHLRVIRTHFSPLNLFNSVIFETHTDYQYFLFLVSLRYILIGISNIVNPGQTVPNEAVC